MKSLYILVMMQLKEQMNFKRLKGEKAKAFSVLLSVIGSVIKFALVTGLCVAFLLVSRILGLFSFQGLPIPDTVISLVFSVMLLLSVISCTVGLTKSMYYARDNAVLLTLPCPSLQVYLSKLIIFFIFEIKRNLSFLVPMFIAYFITHGYGVGAYVWMLFCMLWISLFTVAIGALLSIPTMWIANFFRQHKWIQMTGLVATVAAASLALFFGISLIPENIDLVAAWSSIYWQIQDFLSAYAAKFSYLYDFTRMLLGEVENLSIYYPIGRTALRLLILAGSTLPTLGTGLLIVRPLFYKMASTPFEYLKKPTKPKKNKARNKVSSSIFTNFLITVKNTNTIFANVGILISIPMLVFLLNKIFLAMKTREMGDNMIVAFNVLIMLLIALNSNCAIASLYSRDGQSSYLIKTLPSKYTLPVVAKLLPNTLFGAVAILATAPILLITLPSLNVVDVVHIILAIEFIFIAHMFYSAELDLMNPQSQLYASVGSTVSNPNEMKSTVAAFIISFLAAAAVFLLLLEGEGYVYSKFIFVSLCVLVFRTYMFFSMLKLYYKEK